MSEQFYNTAKAAEVLGVKPADILQLREQNKLHGYRDGADWKFKVEEIQDYLANSIKAKHEADGDFDLGDDVLGGSEPQAGGGSDLELAGSDLELTETEFELAGSDLNLGSESAEPGGSDLELDLTLDQDVTLEGSDIALASEEKVEGGSDVEVGGDVLEDDALVLGGSGAGSDITIGGDSGISLVDPADSGLSLDEPLELTGDDEESLELGEDDMLTLSEDAETESPTELKTDDEFLLTPLEEAGDDEESGSQVIALDTEDESMTMVPDEAAMPAMLDEDMGGADQMGFDAAGLEGAAPMVDMAQAAAVTSDVAPMPTGQAALPEAPYSGLVVWLGLFPCTLMLVLAGMMSFDLIRNMWTWQGTMTLNSTLLDTLKGMLF